MTKNNAEALTPNRVKRNLNLSFNNTPHSQTDSPGLNYSVVDDVDDEKPLILKLRLSKNQPKVLVEKLDDTLLENLIELQAESVKKLQIHDDVSTPRTLRNRKLLNTPSAPPSSPANVRRSTRNVNRVSYVELISPVKNYRRKDARDDDDEYYSTSPRKRSRKPSVTESERSLKENVADINIMKVNQAEVLSTPRKRTITPRCDETPSKKLSHREEIEMLIKGVKEYNLRTPVKQLLRTPVKKRETPVRNTPVAKTPIARTPVRKTPLVKTPSRIKMIREGVLTPTMQSRKSSAATGGTPLNIAKTKLHVSHVPKSLPCRENEYSDVMNFVEGKLLDGCGGCMYVSGVPGTGKTATVTEVIRNLQSKSKKSIPEFKYVSINGMRLTEPRQAYVEIVKQLTGRTVPWEQAHNILENKFTKTKPRKEDLPIVLLVDELDILCTKRQDVVYNLLDWPSKAKTQLIVITIANTMDLPERLLMGRVTSRLGLTRLTFQAYTYKQLQEIVTNRLIGTKAFKPDAIQLVARKVASVSGDARRALDICRRAVEIAESEDENGLVSMQHVNDALNAMITQPKVQAIKRSSRLEQLLLQAVVAEVERTGVDETNFADIFAMFETIAALDGFPLVSTTLGMAAVSRLGVSRLLLTEQKANDIYQKIILNVSSDDIYYALRKD